MRTALCELILKYRYRRFYPVIVSFVVLCISLMMPLSGVAELLSNSSLDTGHGGWGKDGASWIGAEFYTGEFGTTGASFKGWATTPPLPAMYQTVSVSENIRYHFVVRAIRQSAYQKTSYVRLTWKNGGGGTIRTDEKSYPYTEVGSAGAGGNFSSGDGTLLELDVVSPLGVATVEARFGASITNFYAGCQHFWDNPSLFDQNTNYLSGTCVEEFSYYAHGKYDDFDGTDWTNFNRGYGWTNEWDASSSVWVGTNSFSDVTGYPVNRGNKLRMAPPAAGATQYAQRNFEAVNDGTLFAAFMMTYQTSGSDRFCGLSFMSNDVTEAFVGEIEAADQRLGVSDYAGAGVCITSTVALNAGSDYLVIGAYSFKSRTLRTKAYASSASVPSTIPSSWDTTTQVAVGSIESINGIRLTAGGDSVTPGNCYFDELRVAPSWNQILGDEDGMPYVTNVFINNGVACSDAEMIAGAFPVVAHIRSEEGLSTSTSFPYFAPCFDFVDPSGDEILVNQDFASTIHIDSGETVIASNTSHAVASAISGVYTMRISAVASNSVSMINMSTLANGTAMTFTVVDDDTTGPVFSGFSMDGYYYSLSSVASGLHITGLVQDAESGIQTNISYALVSNTTFVGSGSFTNYPAANGDGQAHQRILV